MSLKDSVMSLIDRITGNKNDKIQSNVDFWKWYQSQEKDFFKVIKTRGNFEKNFFNILSAKLNQLKEGYFYLVGMLDDNTVELILTPDGCIKNILFVEELVASAPVIKGWKFTALKPESDINDVSIQMDGYTFSAETISFYENEHEDYPDEIDLSIVHDQFKKEDEKTFVNGTYIFLDNLLGELTSVTLIDGLKVIGKKEVTKELIPIHKLKDYLHWRQKEFIEKYEGIRHDTHNDTYSSLEGKTNKGNPMVAVINDDLINWDCKASHPWILSIKIKYDGSSQNGMPDEQTYALMEEIEKKILEDLIDHEGYLNVGRQTVENEREIYFACKEFRRPSKVIYNIMNEYAALLEMEYDIIKDKYWQSLEKFVVH